MNCLIATSCKAGMCLTPSFEAIQVVPQKKLTKHNANIGNPTIFIFVEMAFLILAFTLQIWFCKSIF